MSESLVTIDREALDSAVGGNVPANSNMPMPGMQNPADLCAPNGVRSVSQSGLTIPIPGRIPNIDVGPIHVNNGTAALGQQTVECNPPPSGQPQPQ